jgi:N-methylhydantoinase A
LCRAHSAYGALAADVQFSADRSLLMRGGGGPAPLWQGLNAEMIEHAFRELEEQCEQAMRRAGVPAQDVQLVRTVDLRYRRQTNDLMIAVPERPVTDQALTALVDRFEESYEQTYGKGSAFREAGIELTNARVEAFGRARRPELNIRAPSAAPNPTRRKIFEPSARAWMDTAVYQWRELPAGFAIKGPAMIEHPETSVFVALGQTAALDATANITIQTSGDR